MLTLRGAAAPVRAGTALSVAVRSGRVAVFLTTGFRFTRSSGGARRRHGSSLRRGSLSRWAYDSAGFRAGRRSGP